jgi:hypothetical protein
MKRESAGGAATAAGMDFQNRVAAWYCVAIIAEQDVTVPLCLGSGTTFESIRSETGLPIDDLLIETSAGGFIFGQVKRTISLSQTRNSGFASALNQFVCQFVANQSRIDSPRPCERPLDPERDRFALIVSPTSSSLISRDLVKVLDRVRSSVGKQTTEDFAKNKDEWRALQFTLDHLRESWRSTMGKPPTLEVLYQLLSLVYVQVLDVDQDGAAERESLNTLSQTVLKDPGQAEASWKILIAFCGHMAKSRGGANREVLQRTLTAASVDVREPSSYREDIKRIRDHTETSLELLSDLSRIEAGNRVVKIERTCVEELWNRALESSALLVVGQPGAGKSGSLHSLGVKAKKAEYDVVVMLVDRIASSSLGELRNELGLEHEIVEVLRQWPGTRPALLVIDALDAARGLSSANTFRDLMRLLIKPKSRWNVIASVREFDLRYSNELQELFRCEDPSTVLESEFASLNYVNIPCLSDEEVENIARQSPELAKLIEIAPLELRDLIRILFNIRLIADLLSTGLDPSQLTSVRTQLELLERYWDHRIIGSDSLGDQRENVLLIACEEMVKERRLQIDRAILAKSASVDTLNILLSSHVLSEWSEPSTTKPNRYIIRFSHNVLFDYAVACLLLRRAPDALLNLLITDPDFAVVARPSIEMHFQYLWVNDRNRFWSEVFNIVRSKDTHTIARIIGVSVATFEATDVDDLTQITEMLKSDNTETKDAAEEILEYVVGTLYSNPIPLVGTDAGPWCAFAEHISRNISARSAFPLGSLLRKALEDPDKLTTEQIDAVGLAARRLLQFAWRESTDDDWLVIVGLQSTCRTFRSSPEEAGGLIRQAIVLAHLQEHGFKELPFIAKEVRYIIESAPDLVTDIYIAAFGYQESSTDPTSLGPSRILSILSTRRQDYGLALWQLSEQYRSFLELAPLDATRALVDVLETYILHKHAVGAKTTTDEELFAFRGREARYVRDYSSVWDSGDVYGNDEPIKMLQSLEEYISALVEQQNVDLLEAILDVAAQKNRFAFFWRRLLRAATTSGVPLSNLVADLACAQPILLGIDTSNATGEFLKAQFSCLDSSTRGSIEEAILAIPEYVDGDSKDRAKETRARLLGCLDETAITRDATLELLHDLRAVDAVPKNQAPIRFSDIASSPYTEEEYLAERGVRLDDGINAHLFALTKPVTAFASEFLNEIPDEEDLSSIIEDLRILHDTLHSPDMDNANMELRDQAWGHLASACSKAARIRCLNCGDEDGRFIRAVLIEASNNRQPEYDSVENAQFDEFPAWGTPAARIDSAEGLLTLSLRGGCLTDDVMEEIVRLSRDDVSAVRFQIATHLMSLYDTKPEIVWEIAERMVSCDPSISVLYGLLNHALAPLARAYPDRVVVLLQTSLERFGRSKKTQEYRRTAYTLLSQMYIFKNHSGAREIVMTTVSELRNDPTDAHFLVNTLRDALTYGENEETAEDIRSRAFDLLLHLLQGAVAGLSQLGQGREGETFDDLPETEKDRVKEFAAIIKSVSDEVYFASGAYDLQIGKRTELVSQTPEKTARFYHEASDLFNELVEISIPAAIHPIVQTLETLIPEDPPGVFLRIADIVRSSRKGGYQQESLAAELIVRIVERYLADYQDLLLENADCRRALVEVLDTFVGAGWPTAQQLTYRLKEIFR